MSSWLARTELLIGKEAIEKLADSRVLVVGMGGVGSYAAEYLCRAGIGKMTIVDGDVIESTNRNRQLPALVSSEGAGKAEWMQKRMLDINPALALRVVNDYMIESKLQEIILADKYDYAIDAIDTITPKLAMIKTCLEHNVPIVSSMGAGGKLDPTKLKIADIWKSYNCPFAQQIRKKMKKWGIRKKLKVVFSSELPDKKSVQLVENQRHKKSYYGTISYIPSMFGAFCASVVIRDIAAV
jgi:tRNA A37 threonylcarbamoyladenosine dehydratase